MGQRGPVPKRSSERRRRNKDSETKTVKRPATPPSPGRRPSQSAPKPAWVAHATAVGIANATKLTKAELIAAVGVEPPTAPGGADDVQPDERWHAIAKSWFLSLRDSGQANFYEPSDWQAARYVAEVMSKHLKARKPSAQMFAALWAAMGDLLTTEAARRRVRLEIEREPEDDTSGKVTSLDAYRDALG